MLPYSKKHRSLLLETLKHKIPKSQKLAAALIKHDPELIFHDECGLSCLHYIARDGLLHILEVITSRVKNDDRFLRLLESECASGIDCDGPETALDIAIKNAKEGRIRWQIMERLI